VSSSHNSAFAHLLGRSTVGRGVTRLLAQQLRRVPTAVERNQPAIQTAGMAKKQEPPKPITWDIYKIASKGVWLGGVDAPDEAAAIEKAAAEFKVPANRLMAVRR
jgi:hypothetical protein